MASVTILDDLANRVDEYETKLEEIKDAYDAEVSRLRATVNITVSNSGTNEMETNILTSSENDMQVEIGRNDSWSFVIWEYNNGKRGECLDTFFQGSLNRISIMLANGEFE